MTRVKLDLNDPQFQADLFQLTKELQLQTLATFKKIREMDWLMVYRDKGLHWERIQRKSGPHGQAIYSFRINKKCRGVACWEGDMLRVLSIHPDHDSAYQ